MYTLLLPARANALMRVGYIIYAVTEQDSLTFYGFQVPYRDGDTTISRLPDSAFNYWGQC